MERFDPNPIINRATYAPLASEIPFCCLDGDVPEEKLDLFEFTARCVAKARARAPKIMGRQFLDSCLLGAVFDHVPDNPLRNAITPGFPSTADTPEQAAIADFGGIQP